MVCGHSSNYLHICDVCGAKQLVVRLDADASSLALSEPLTLSLSLSLSFSLPLSTSLISPFSSSLPSSLPPSNDFL